MVAFENREQIAQVGLRPYFLNCFQVRPNPLVLGYKRLVGLSENRIELDRIERIAE